MSDDSVCFLYRLISLSLVLRRGKITLCPLFRNGKGELCRIEMFKFLRDFKIVDNSQIFYDFSRQKLK